MCSIPAVAALLIASLALPLHAQPPAIPVTVDLPPRVGVADGPARPLTLDEAVRLTLEQNNDVTIARLETRAAREAVNAAAGIFDLRLFPSLSYQRSTTPSASAIGGAVNGRLEQNQVFATLGLDGRSPWGGRYTVDFTSTRVRTSNQFARLNPQYPTALGAGFIQPLFRGRAIDQERRQIAIARRATDLTDAQLAQVVTEQLTLVEEAYWNLVFAARNLEVQAQALAQARGQVTSNERQAQEGTLAPIDVVEAQTQVANFRQNVASAQQALTEAENRLKSLMQARRDGELWDQALAPADSADRPVPQTSLEEALQAAMARRPELRALETARAQNEIDQRFFRDLAKPQVDVVGSYTLAGLAGAPLTAAGAPVGGSATDAAILARLNQLSVQAGLLPLETPPPTTGATVPDFFQGAYGASLNNLFARRFPTALVQLQVELPFGNGTAKANVARAEIAAEQIARQRQRLEQVIELEVRNALQAVRSSEERLDAAASAQRNASEQYESERRRFESGLSTVFLVLERQTALVNAQARELRARADLNQAIAVLDRAVGGTLERHGVALTEGR